MYNRVSSITAEMVKRMDGNNIDLNLFTHEQLGTPIRSAFIEVIIEIKATMTLKGCIDKIDPLSMHKGNDYLS
jgi:hypothetical protein